MKRKRFFALFLVFCFLFQISSFAQINFDIQPAQFDERIHQQVEAGSIPGISVQIFNREGAIYTFNDGKTGNGNELVSQETPFIVGSIAKSFTSLAALNLINEGQIDLKSPVEVYIPWFKLTKPNGQSILIKDLIEHTSGLTTLAGEQAYTYNQDYDLEDLVKKINETEKTAYLYNSNVQYSNLNYIILGYLIELTSGMSYESYIQETIIAPLNLEHTGFNQLVGNKAQGFRRILGFNLKTEVPYPKGLAASSYLYSSTEDLVSYGMLLLNNGYIDDKSLITGNEVDKINTELGANQDYYSALWEVTNGATETDYNGYFGVIGTNPNFNSALILNQDTGLGIIVLINQNNAYQSPAVTAQTIANDLTDLIIGKTPYEMNSKNKTGQWLMVLFAFLITIYLINESITSYRMIKDRAVSKMNYHLKYLNYQELIRLLFSIAVYFGFPMFYDNSWRFFTAANPEWVLPILWIVVINLLQVMLVIMMRVKAFSKK